VKIIKEDFKKIATVDPQFNLFEESKGYDKQPNSNMLTTQKIQNSNLSEDPF
jgi:hypothetical protein